MKAVIQILRASFSDIWADLWTLLICNLFWLFAVLLILPGPPATLALFYICNQIARGEVFDLGDFWGAFRRWWKPAWRWGAVFLLVIAVFILDFIMAGHFQTSWKPYLQGLYIVLAGCWSVVNFFALSFLFEQNEMRISQALRNAVVLIGKNIGFTMELLVLLLIILTAGSIAFLLSVMLGAVFAACVSNHSVLNMLEKTRSLDPEN